MCVCVSLFFPVICPVERSTRRDKAKSHACHSHRSAAYCYLSKGGGGGKDIKYSSVSVYIECHAKSTVRRLHLCCVDVFTTKRKIINVIDFSFLCFFLKINLIVMKKFD